MTFTAHDRNLSVFHHPVLTVLVDDSKSFIDSLAFQMDCLLYTSDAADDLLTV